MNIMKKISKPESQEAEQVNSVSRDCQERIFLEYFFISNAYSEYGNNIKVQIRKKTQQEQKVKRKHFQCLIFRVY